MNLVLTSPEFDAALAAFIAATEARIEARRVAHFPNTSPALLELEHGLKYIRVVKRDGGSRSAFCFVRKPDGAILMAAGWKKPAKHARGSIFVNAGQDAVTEYGARYLR